MDKSSESLISIIIPVYNVEQYLDKCIQSAQDQTYQNLQIILIDDGSEDRSGEICDRCAAQDPRITVLHQENQGLSAARNRGLEYACGEYILFLDSDDWIYPKACEYLYHKAIEYQADIVQFRAKCNVQSSKSEDETVQIYDGKDLLYLAISGQWGWTAWSNFYHRSVWQSIRFENGFVYEDTLLLPELRKAAKQCVKVNKILYYYTRRSDGILRHPKSALHLKSQKRVYEKFLEIGANSPEEMPMIAYYICADIASYRQILRPDQNLSEKEACEHKQYINKMYHHLYKGAVKSEQYQKASWTKKVLWFCYLISPAISNLMLTGYKRCWEILNQKTELDH